ncbi:MAG: hypothetical protein AB1696_22870 [Planctomycetota bacterium]
MASFLAGCSRGETPTASPTVICRKGTFRVVLREKGLIGALRETTIKSPTSRQIVQIAPEGATVQEGDILLRLDPSGLEEHIKDRKADLQIARAEHARRKASFDAAVHYAEQNVLSARMSQELAKQELANACAGLLTPEAEKIMAASDVKKSKIDVEDETRKLTVAKELQRTGVGEQRELDVRTVEKDIAEVFHRKARVIHGDVMDGLSGDEIREYEFEVELANFRLTSAEKDLRATKERNERYLKQAERRIEWAAKALAKAEEEYAETIVRSPAKGVVLIKSNWGQKYTPGMWAYRNREVIGLPDLSKMKVAAFVEESMAARIQKGQKALIRAPATGDKIHYGTVIRVGGLPKDISHDLDSAEKLIVARAERRVFEMDIAIDEADSRLKPEMHAEVEIILEEAPDTVAIPRSAVEFDDGKAFVNVISEEGIRRQAVTIAAEGEQMVAVSEGLEDGSEVLLSSD